MSNQTEKEADFSCSLVMFGRLAMKMLQWQTNVVHENSHHQEMSVGIILPVAFQEQRLWIQKMQQTPRLLTNHTTQNKLAFANVFYQNRTFSTWFYVFTFFWPRWRFLFFTFSWEMSVCRDSIFRFWVCSVTTGLSEEFSFPSPVEQNEERNDRNPQTLNPIWYFHLINARWFSSYVFIVWFASTNVAGKCKVFVSLIRQMSLSKRAELAWEKCRAKIMRFWDCHSPQESSSSCVSGTGCCSCR